MIGQDVRMFDTDESYRGRKTKVCECCGQPSERTWCMVRRNGQPYAVYFAACYDHRGEVRETWVDVVFGTWGDGADYGDHVTFGCRFGPVSNSDLPAATAVDAAAVASDGPLYGHKLSREEALAHPRIADFWQVFDFVLETDPLVHEHHYGHHPQLR
ncbi:hypothetical protein Rhe02_90570 [Rhizocola hellebori]|uniref:Uncharacterized protein n=1 Tax=Rhizocola hellebori TaxID=1392758 RepID=A0A8J3VLM3_9ACTN|nr:hypothetical protein [Rhizocola hellebori]GIH10990.1 hypothetical protein Rhe02_90570 [Rhizocola hellebori]